jgi:nitroreductase
VDFADLIRRRRMTRAFLAEPVPRGVLDRVLDRARRVPSAGNSQGYDFVVLEGPQTARYWDVTLPGERRENFRWQGLLTAPVVITVWADPQAYLRPIAVQTKSIQGWVKVLTLGLRLIG